MRVEGTVKHMWTLRQAAQQYAITTLRPMTAVAQIKHWMRTGERLWFSPSQILAAWKHQSAYLRQHRHLRTRGRRAKRELLDEQLQLAWEADRQGDKASLWKVVRRLAPKTAKVQVQLRGAQGAVVSRKDGVFRTARRFPPGRYQFVQNLTFGVASIVRARKPE